LQGIFKISGRCFEVGCFGHVKDLHDFGPNVSSADHKNKSCIRRRKYTVTVTVLL
jgi:hypothetical protein